MTSGPGHSSSRPLSALEATATAAREAADGAGNFSSRGLTERPNDRLSVMRNTCSASYGPSFSPSPIAPPSHPSVCPSGSTSSFGWMVRSKMDGWGAGGRPCSGRKDECPLLSLRPSLPLIHRGRGWSRWSRSALSFPTDDHTCGLEGDTRGLGLLSHLARATGTVAIASLHFHCMSVIAKAALCLADRNSTRWSSQGRLFYVLFFPPRPSPSRSPLTPPLMATDCPSLVLPPDPSPAPSVVGASAPQVGTQIFPPKAA